MSRVLWCLFFSISFSYPVISKSQSCEEFRASQLAMWTSECNKNSCTEIPGHRSCVTFGPASITKHRFNYGWQSKVYCTIKTVIDDWDISVPPERPPVQTVINDFLEGWVAECLPNEVRPSGPPPGGPGGDGKPGSCTIAGSVVQVEVQSLGEVVPVQGLAFDMSYSSSLQKGFLSNFKISQQVVGGIPRDYIQSFEVQLFRDGIIVDSQTFDNSIPNQNYTYIWDGLDSAGLNSVASAKFVLNLKETSPAGVFDGKTEIVLGQFDASKAALGGWLPSVYKWYDVGTKRLYSADGSYDVVEAKSYGIGQQYIAAPTGKYIYIFDSNGRHLSTKTALVGGEVYSFSHDSLGRLNSISEPFGRITTFDRNSSGQLISITAPNGQVTLIGLDLNGYISSFTSPNSDSYLITYDINGLMQTYEKPNAEVSTFLYDADGLLIKDSHSGGYFFELVRNLSTSSTFDVGISSVLGRSSTVQTVTSADGLISRITTSPSGMVSSSAFEVAGSVASRSDTQNGGSRNIVFSDDPRFGPMVRVPQSEYIQLYGGGNGRAINFSLNVTLANPADPFSISTWQETAQLSGANTQVTTVFNPATKKFTATTYLGKITEWGIDTYERLVSTKQGTLNQTTYTYTNENLTSIAQGTRTTSFGYNSLGLLETVTNPLSQTTSYVYNSANRMTSQILPDSRVVGFAYDGVGNITSVTPPGRPAHIFSLNGHGLMGGYEPPALSGVSVVNTTYSYNLDKQLTSIVRPDGGFINYNYNATTGVLESVETPAGFYYHSLDTTVGLPNYISDPLGNSTQIGYVGRSPASYSISNASGSFGYSTVYGTANRLESDTVSSPLGTTSVISYLYNDDEDLRKAGDVNLTYNVPNGQLTGTTMGSGTTGFTDTYTYNNYGEVTGYQTKRGTTVIYDLTLNRDAMGRIDGKTQVMNAVADNYVYTFDSTGRLTQTNKNSATVATYSYDSNSNRNGGTIGAQPTTATYDDQDRLLTYNTLSFTYNANGDLLTKTNSATSTTTQYVYDVFGNLTQVTLPSGAVITYEIDALNRRTGKLVNGVVQKRWIYMDQYRIAAELNAAGTITKRFIYGSKGNIPDYMIASGVKYRIISDHLGSPRLVVKQSDGTVIQRMDHDEYGRVIADTNPGYLPFGFAGGMYDHQTSLIRFGARDYDSEVGRWTSKDPILFNGDMTNLYGYSFNDPVNFIDINGLSPEDVKRIQAEFNSMVTSMNRVGARRPGSGLGNGILNNIISTVQTLSSEGYLGCIDQANLTSNQLQGVKTDDKWSFSVVPNATNTHHFIRATSSNPLDPVLTIDPWLNSFGTGK